MKTLINMKESIREGPCSRGRIWNVNWRGAIVSRIFKSKPKFRFIKCSMTENLWIAIPLLKGLICYYYHKKGEKKEEEKKDNVSFFYSVSYTVMLKVISFCRKTMSLISVNT